MTRSSSHSSCEEIAECSPWRSSEGGSGESGAVNFLADLPWAQPSLPHDLRSRTEGVPAIPLAAIVTGSPHNRRCGAADERRPVGIIASPGRGASFAGRFGRCRPAARHCAIRSMTTETSIEGVARVPIRHVVTGYSTSGAPTVVVDGPAPAVVHLPAEVGASLVDLWRSDTDPLSTVGSDDATEGAASLSCHQEVCSGSSTSYRATTRRCRTRPRQSTSSTSLADRPRSSTARRTHAKNSRCRAATPSSNRVHHAWVDRGSDRAGSSTRRSSLRCPKGSTSAERPRAQRPRGAVRGASMMRAERRA